MRLQFGYCQGTGHLFLFDGMGLRSKPRKGPMASLTALREAGEMDVADQLASAPMILFESWPAGPDAPGFEIVCRKGRRRPFFVVTPEGKMLPGCFPTFDAAAEHAADECMKRDPESGSSPGPG